MNVTRDHGFFVGYFNAVPRAIAVRSLGAGAALLLVFAMLALMLGRGTDVAAEGQNFADSEVSLTGTVRTKPYLMLQVLPDAAFPDGRAMLLSGEGKRLPPDLVDGRGMNLKGLLLQRGSLDMLLVGKAEMSAITAPISLDAKPMGRWRVSGEICDGKCAAGAMHPGTGLAHKACANLCLSGSLPPVLAMRVPLLGASFLLLADADGGPVPATAQDLTALPVELEGDLERLGDILVLKANWPKARAL